MRRLVLATRGSALALVQARGAAEALARSSPGLEVELRVVRSEGDQRADAPLAEAGGQGLFTRALEDALERGEADAAVHSLKDLPTEQPPQLALAAIGEREDWRDAWLSPAHASPWDLPQGARVGTDSPRRRAQLAARRADLSFRGLRGNVDTRLRKLDEGAAEGAVLALAGLRRLGLEGRVRRVLGEDEMLPAPGQGFVAIEARPGTEAFALCRQAFNRERDEALASCERAFLRRLRAGCMAPVGALARAEGGAVRLEAFAALDPSRPVRTRLEGELRDAAGLGERLAERVLAGRA